MRKILLTFVASALALSMFAQAEHYINLSPKIGYANMMDNLKDGSAISGKKLMGGGGAGLGLLYELQYVTNAEKNQRFLFNVGADFDWLHGLNYYDFSLTRPMTTPYSMDYRYRFMGLAENRNVATIGLPINVGGQFGNFYFLVGAKVGYNLFGKYQTMGGSYQVTAYDPAVGAEIGGDNSAAGTGLFTLDKGEKQALAFSIPEVRVLGEFGLDLDPWLQVQKKKGSGGGRSKKPKFTASDIHYRLGLFAEYGVLNSNKMALADNAVAFASASDVKASSAASMLTQKNTDGSLPALNNLLVGVKFTVQFQIPQKKKQAPQGAAMAPYKRTFMFYHNDTAGHLMDSVVTMEVRNLKTARTSESTSSKGKIMKSFSRADYVLLFSANNYYPDSMTQTIDTFGVKDTVKIAMKPYPYFRICLTDAKTGKPIVGANVQVQSSTRGIRRVSMRTGADGCARVRQPLDPKGENYKVTVTKPGYEAYTANLATIGDELSGVMEPVKRSFILKNMFFDTNKTEILPESEPELLNLLEFMKEEPSRRIRIVGHTDNQGKDAANQILSEGRANAVRDALIERGIDASRIEAEGRGESQPIDTNDTPEGRQNNRRVEVEILGLD